MLRENFLSSLANLVMWNELKSMQKFSKEMLINKLLFIIQLPTYYENGTIWCNHKCVCCMQHNEEKSINNQSSKDNKELWNKGKLLH
ncbi:CLUMA_CG018580, isoform A [Clunio marinus]|uniref:CLUMA_CG018580, isoform A n=1 Tax=Clunio marinus TaxID=568069 RepID=A0A1J1J0J1_9DIPT|nr:CLUMA_CG018580, isoform A [Clunio marinus]